MRLAFGCFLFYTREAFDAVGGFDTSIYATEEVTLSLALRAKADSLACPIAHRLRAGNSELIRRRSG
jgi:hypothetical protein